jgi:predicted Zn-dependent protease with MMP-like domain
MPADPLKRSHAAIVLRTIARTTFRSLPKDARRVLDGVQVYFADDLEHFPGLEHRAGTKILGLARSDGNVVILDRAILEQLAHREGDLEGLLAHELAHCYRSRLGMSDPDKAREEAATDRLVRSWGIRQRVWQ